MLIVVARIVMILPFVLLNAAFLTWLERKVLGHIHVRYGPLVTGPHGLLQPIADAVKLLFKEDCVPSHADKFVYWLAPAITFVPSFILYVTIPIGPKLVLSELDLALFFIFAVSALIPMAFTLAGWSSFNKYSLLGGLRAAAQQISYEVPLLLSVLGVVMMAGSFRFSKIVEAQAQVPYLGSYLLIQPLGFLLFILSALAELNRTPFDMPEAESELVSGFNTEYSGFKFALFFLSEYSNMFVLSAIAALLFLGGWNGPVLWAAYGGAAVWPVVWFILKTYVVVFLILWFRGTLPRLRVDQLMEFSWKILMPVALLNLMLTGALVAAGVV